MESLVAVTTRFLGAGSGDGGSGGFGGSVCVGTAAGLESSGAITFTWDSAGAGAFGTAVSGAALGGPAFFAVALDLVRAGFGGAGITSFGSAAFFA